LFVELLKGRKSIFFIKAAFLIYVDSTINQAQLAATFSSVIKSNKKENVLFCVHMPTQDSARNFTKQTRDICLSIGVQICKRP